MQSARRSAVVAEAQNEYFLIEARIAFRALKMGRRLDPARDGMLLSPSAGRYRLVGADPAAGTVTLDSGHEDYAGDQMLDPPACFCPNCDQPAREPGQCNYCGSTVECV
jgi:hypothetical protein